MNQKWNNNKRRCECKNPKEHNVFKKEYIWNPATYSCKNGKYLGSIIDDSVITCDEIIKTTKISSTETFSSRAFPTKEISTNFYILLAFLSMTIALFIVVSIYCYLVKYRKKQKHLLPYHVTTNELKEVLY